MSEIKRYLVMIDDEHRDKLPEMAEKLQAVGCQVERLMENLGIIGVSVATEQAPAISQIQGVTTVTSGEEPFQAL